MRFEYVILVVAAFIGATFLIISRSRAAGNSPPKDISTFDEQHRNLPKDALNRRARSNAVMRAEGVPLNEWLPAIESEDEVKLPLSEKVAMRAAATLVVALKGHGMSQERIEGLVRKYDLNDWFSPKELKFIRDSDPIEREREIQVWRYEAAKTLLWAVGFVEQLDGPRQLADPKKLESIVLNQTRKQFVESAKLRSKSEILDQADLIYRYRWALVDARLHERAAPAGLNDDVAMERHQALNWLIEEPETDWDDISLDT